MNIWIQEAGLNLECLSYLNSASFTLFSHQKRNSFLLFFICCFHVLYPNFFVKLQAIKNYIFWFVSSAGIFILLFISCPSSVLSQTNLLTQALRLRGVLLFCFREWPGVWRIVLHNFQVDGSTMACYACLVHGLQRMLCAALNDIYPFCLVILLLLTRAGPSRRSWNQHAISWSKS